MPYHFLFVVCSGDGHVNPMLPAARALRERGHRVEFAGPAFAVPYINANGFQALPVGLPRGIMGIVEASRVALGGAPPTSPPTFCEDPFVTLAGAMALDLVERVTEPPDVVVRDTLGFGGWLAADRWGIPVASIDTHRPSPKQRRGEAPAFDEVRRQLGLPIDPTTAGADAWLGIHPAPAGWTLPVHMARTTHLVQPGPTTGGDLPDLPWLQELEPPVVYVTLGTVPNEAPDLWPMVLTAIAEVGVSAVATIGRSTLRPDFGGVPERIRIERYVPQDLVLPRCSAVVAHGGFGTLTGALAQGLPIVSVPLSAGDNLPNARRIERLGAGLAITEGERDPSAIARALERVLVEPSFRIAAEATARETRRLPPPAHAATLLERLAATRAPVFADAG